MMMIVIVVISVVSIRIIIIIILVVGIVIIIIVIVVTIIVIIIIIIVVVITGVQGLCLGILLGAAATDASFYFLMWRTDWSLEADKAAERVGVKTLSGSADVSLGSIASLPMQEMNDSSEQQCAAGGEAARLLAGHLPMDQHQH